MLVWSNVCDLWASIASVMIPLIGRLIHCKQRISYTQLMVDVIIFFHQDEWWKDNTYVFMKHANTTTQCRHIFLNKIYKAVSQYILQFLQLAHVSWNNIIWYLALYITPYLRQNILSPIFGPDLQPPAFRGAFIQKSCGVSMIILLGKINHPVSGRECGYVSVMSH